MEQKKIHRPEWELQVKLIHLLLGHPNLHRAGSRCGKDKCIKGGSQDRLKPLLWGRPALMSWGCTILCLPNKTLSYNRAVTLVRHLKSLLRRDRSEEITHSPNNSKAIFFNILVTGTFKHINYLKPCNLPIQYKLILLVDWGVG